VVGARSGVEPGRPELAPVATASTREIRCGERTRAPSTRSLGTRQPADATYLLSSLPCTRGCITGPALRQTQATATDVRRRRHCRCRRPPPFGLLDALRSGDVSRFSIERALAGTRGTAAGRRRTARRSATGRIHAELRDREQGPRSIRFRPPPPAHGAPGHRLAPPRGRLALANQ
jgi:hypothetical protein